MPEQWCCECRRLSLPSGFACYRPGAGGFSRALRTSLAYVVAMCLYVEKSRRMDLVYLRVLPGLTSLTVSVPRVCQVSLMLVHGISGPHTVLLSVVSGSGVRPLCRLFAQCCGFRVRPSCVPTVSQSLCRGVPASRAGGDQCPLSLWRPAVLYSPWCWQQTVWDF